MTRRMPLPTDIHARPFTIAHSARLGVARSRTRASDLERPFLGVRVPPAAGGAYSTRCRALLVALDSPAVLCGVSAARLHDLPLPPRIDPHSVEVAVRPPRRAVRRTGVIGRRLALRDAEIEYVDELPVTTVARTWCDLASTLGLGELVAIGDAVGNSLGEAAVARLATATRERSDRRHSLKLLRALELIDHRAESPKESELRMLLAFAGLPRPEVNPTIRDGGRFVARVDLLFRAHRVIVEYQGDHHRTDRSQWRRDVARRSELESLGYAVIEVTQADLRRPAMLVTLIRRVLASRG